MKIEVGKWIRTSDNEFVYIDKKEIKGIIDTTSGLYYLASKIIQVSSRPQELIQVGDLIGIGDCKFIVMYIENNDNIYIYDDKFDYRGVNKEDIKSIHTHNEDKSVYTLQWSKGK